MAAPVCGKSCQAERERLRSRVEQLETALGLTDFPPGLAHGLSPTLHKLLGMLLARDCVSKEAFHTVFYSARPDERWPESDMLNVSVCKLRSKLKPIGIPIKNAWARGYYIEQEYKQKATEHFGFGARPAEVSAEVPARKSSRCQRRQAALVGPFLPDWLPVEYADLYRVLKVKLGRSGEVRRVIEDQIAHDARRAARVKI